MVAHLFKGILLYTFSLMALGCNGRSPGDPSVTEKSAPDNSILRDLQSVKGKGVLFGHQDDLAYGVDWHYQDGGSDVKRVSGDYPALFGWELGGLERGDRHNLDGVPFDRMRELAIKAHEMGGINTFSWHPYEAIQGRNSWTPDADVVRHLLPGADFHEAFKSQLDRVALFLKSIKSEDESQVPFIFRPWHEMDGNWFWWGSEQCSPEDFQKLFAFTVRYLREEKKIEDMLRRKVRMIEFDTRPSVFARNLLYPAKNLDISQEDTIINIAPKDMQSRAKVIGRNSSNLLNLQGIIR